MSALRNLVFKAVRLSGLPFLFVKCTSGKHGTIVMFHDPAPGSGGGGIFVFSQKIQHHRSRRLPRGPTRQPQTARKSAHHHPRRRACRQPGLVTGAGKTRIRSLFSSARESWGPTAVIGSNTEKHGDQHRGAETGFQPGKTATPGSSRSHPTGNSRNRPPSTPPKFTN